MTASMLRPETTPTKPQNESLGAALLDIVRRPVTNLVAAWNWKTAAVSVVIRAALFFTTNLRSGRGSALRASLVEAGFAIFAAGLLGSVIQRLRHAQPVWATGLTVWLGVPVVLLTIQSTVHHAFGTPAHEDRADSELCDGGVWVGVLTGMRSWRGVLVTGEYSQSDDLKRMPGVIWDFLLALPRMALRAVQSARG